MVWQHMTTDNLFFCLYLPMCWYGALFSYDLGIPFCVQLLGSFGYQVGCFWLHSEAHGPGDCFPHAWPQVIGHHAFPWVCLLQEPNQPVCNGVCHFDNPEQLELLMWFYFPTSFWCEIQGGCLVWVASYFISYFWWSQEKQVLLARATCS